MRMGLLGPSVLAVCAWLVAGRLRRLGVICNAVWIEEFVAVPGNKRLQDIFAEFCTPNQALALVPSVLTAIGLIVFTLTPRTPNKIPSVTIARPAQRFHDSGSPRKYAAPKADEPGTMAVNRVVRTGPKCWIILVKVMPEMTTEPTPWNSI